MDGGFAGRYVIQLSDQTVRNRLHTANLQAHKATRKPAMTALLLGCGAGGKTQAHSNGGGVRSGSSPEGRFSKETQK